jgi:hypothetical protein
MRHTIAALKKVLKNIDYANHLQAFIHATTKTTSKQCRISRHVSAAAAPSHKLFQTAIPIPVEPNVVHTRIGKLKCTVFRDYLKPIHQAWAFEKALKRTGNYNLYMAITNRIVGWRSTVLIIVVNVLQSGVNIS